MTSGVPQGSGERMAVTSGVPQGHGEGLRPFVFISASVIEASGIQGASCRVLLNLPVI